MHTTYDLIAIDIDGTLLDSQNRLSPSLAPLFRDVQARGTAITLISGRPAQVVEPLMRALDLSLPYVSSGGAHIADPESGEVIAAFTLQREEVAILAEIGRATGSGLVAMEARQLYYEGTREKFELAHESVDIRLNDQQKIEIHITPVADIVSASPTPLKFTISDLPEVLAKVEERLRASNLPIYSTYSSPVYLESTSIEANKGTALTRLARHLRIPLERVMVIGDSPNDLSMFGVAGTSVAMGNALPDVKSAASLIAPSNDEDGVAWVMQERVLKSGEASLKGMIQ
jgi:Cof subfamily protein (haloacid dehalogenase superfamily)